MFVGACGACMWCMYGYVCFWWSMCCMYVYMHLCRYMCLVMHVCVYMMDIYAPLIGDACDAHACIWYMFVYLCIHFLWCMWCMYVYIVHPCTNVCLVVHVCVYDTHVCTFNWMHVVHMCACGACMCMWCIYAHICVFGVHEYKQVVFHA